MPTWAIDPAIKRDFRQWTMVYPQPISSSLARLLTSRTLPEWVDNCLKTAEVFTRYIAASSVASFSVRTGAEENQDSIEQLNGDFAFGTFANIIRQVNGKEIDHPLKIHLAVYHQRHPNLSGSGGEESPAIWIEKLVQLRNSLGHSLAGISEPRAKRALNEKKPIELLHGLLKCYLHILSLPLFVIEEQIWDRGVLTGQLLLLMGSSKDIVPSPIQLQKGIENSRHPYIAVDNRILDLYPFLIWDSVPNREYDGLLFIDGVSRRKVKYQSLDPEKFSTNGGTLSDLNNLISGKSPIREDLILLNQQNMVNLWEPEQRRLIAASNVLYGNMPWEKCDIAILKWYANRLHPNSTDSPQNVIQQYLFDGKISFDNHEIYQTILLFGYESEIGQLINRDIVDIRVIADGSGRWQERQHFSKNIIQSLNIAVEIFSKVLGIEGVSIESLKQKTGGSDYIAMREALVNMFIHQDYHDARAAAQVDISKNKITFFNMGYSLISNETLVEGGKSQARNPLIARALRLIGFAELAGSGLRELQNSWKTTNRRDPVFTSNREENNFFVSLEKSLYDEFWKEKLGVTLTPQEAGLLNLIANPQGVTLEQCINRSGLSPEEILKTIHYLTIQALIEQKDGLYLIKDHVHQIIDARRA
jgi:predicted HTH transcriptional regulator